MELQLQENWACRQPGLWILWNRLTLEEVRSCSVPSVGSQRGSSAGRYPSTTVRSPVGGWSSWETGGMFPSLSLLLTAWLLISEEHILWWNIKIILHIPSWTMWCEKTKHTQTCGKSRLSSNHLRAEEADDFLPCSKHTATLYEQDKCTSKIMEKQEHYNLIYNCLFPKVVEFPEIIICMITWTTRRL